MTRAGGARRVLKAVAWAASLQLAVAGFPPPAAAQGEMQAYSVPGAREFAMRSRGSLDYRIFVYRPDAPPPPAGYPIIYVLDGNAWFEPVASAVRIQAGRSPMSLVAPAVVVGIGYPTDVALNQPRRFLDFIPDMASEADMAPRLRDFETGGAAEFRTFLLDELPGRIASLAPVDPNRRILFGHSLGCSFVLHLLFTEPRAFPNYVCSSPSLGFGGGYLLEEEEAFRSSLGDARLDIRLLLAAAEYDGRVPPGVPEAYRGQYEAVLRRANVVGGLESLQQRLSSLSANDLESELIVIERENHLSVVPVLVNRMLELMLRPTP